MRGGGIFKKVLKSIFNIEKIIKVERYLRKNPICVQLLKTYINLERENTLVTNCLFIQFKM